MKCVVENYPTRCEPDKALIKKGMKDVRMVHPPERQDTRGEVLTIEEITVEQRNPRIVARIRGSSKRVDQCITLTTIYYESSIWNC